MSVYIFNDFKLHKTNECLICSLDCAENEEIKSQSLDVFLLFLLTGIYGEGKRGEGNMYNFVCVSTGLRKGKGRLE